MINVDLSQLDGDLYCLFDLILHVSSTIFQLNRDGLGGNFHFYSNFKINF